MNRFLFILLFVVLPMAAQHKVTMVAALNPTAKIVTVQQELAYRNDSGQSLGVIVLNDWNNAYSDKNTPLAKRFSDEYVRGFHLAKNHERGSTASLTVIDDNKTFLEWSRPDAHPDIIEIELAEKLEPGKTVLLKLTYLVKLPSDRFTGVGYGDSDFTLKNWFLSPARFENGDFVRYSNNNLDDIANASADYEIEFRVPKNLELDSDLDLDRKTDGEDFTSHFLNGRSRRDFSIYISPKSPFRSYRNDVAEVANGIRDNKLDDIRKAIVVDRIVNFVNENIGPFPHRKIIVSQKDYERSPFYGLNQLPSFISPFPDEFIYEIKFLKTYLNNFLKSSLNLDPRRDNWIYDGIQVYTMMKYIDAHHPGAKMMGSLSKLRLLKSYNLVNLDFNEQYSYFYMLMARKNLDQPIGEPKDRLIKFNEQIAGKYRSGLSLRYLDDYLANDAVSKAIRSFYTRNAQGQATETDFRKALRDASGKNIDWFFDTVIHSRDIIDYKFADLGKTQDSVTFSIVNKTGTNVPMPVYGLRKGNVVYKKWFEPFRTDSTYTIPRNGADKIVINYKNEVPEYNLRNNWGNLRPYSLGNRPIKFNFMKDLEDPYYNQILYVPTLTYNLYDGLSPGIRFHNKTILDKPVLFDMNPVYSTLQQSFTGSFLVAVNQNNRHSSLYNVRYSASGNYFHYAPDAAYLRLNPMVTLRFRDEDFRSNHSRVVLMRQVIVDRDKTNFVIDNSAENYSVFNAKYIDNKTEATRHFRFVSDLQVSDKFSKAAVELGFRRLFENNRQIDLRLYAGTFLHNRTNSDFFSFGLDRPSDYLFDHNYYGRSESTGIFSQQLILAEGGFKSMLSTRYANQWMTTLNAGFNIWNWVEIYGDAGLVKNRGTDPFFAYDSGIRLNLVTDYFELYLPVYSNNGWEIAQPNYNEKVRFIVTLDPRLLVSLFTRKWF